MLKPFSDVIIYFSHTAHPPLPCLFSHPHQPFVLMPNEKYQCISQAGLILSTPIFCVASLFSCRLKTKDMANNAHKILCLLDILPQVHSRDTQPSHMSLRKVLLIFWNYVII
jgi:hypothetical protein